MSTLYSLIIVFALFDIEIAEVGEMKRDTILAKKKILDR